MALYPRIPQSPPPGATRSTVDKRCRRPWVRRGSGICEKKQGSERICSAVSFIFEQMRSLPCFFSQIPDPRRTQGRRHRLSTVLGIAAGGVLCGMRSEEHTSELQSRLHLVCRLLLEKKKHTTSTPSSASSYRSGRRGQLYRGA